MKLQNRQARLIVLSLLCGIVAGLSSTLFVATLNEITEIREHHLWIICFLPLAGLSIGTIYHFWGPKSVRGNSLVFEEIHDPKKTLPLSMAPLIFISTCITHLFGGSTGREGAAVQISASLSDQFSHLFKVKKEERKALLIAGTGAGFGAALGTPWAGVLFGIEVIHIGKLKPIAVVECFIASWSAYIVTQILVAPHSEYSQITNINFSLYTLLIVILWGLLCGLIARFFSQSVHLLEKTWNKLISTPILRAPIMGLIIVALYYWDGSFQYDGLGLPLIQEAMQTPSSFSLPVGKFLFTICALASGYKGGEFVPLVFIGSTLGSVLSSLAHMNTQLMACLGFAAVFAGAANAPLTCAVMAIELFGTSITPYALLACFCSYYSSGYVGIYKGQKILQRKFHLWGRFLGKREKKILP